jgi:hypothetical protein
MGGSVKAQSPRNVSVSWLVTIAHAADDAASIVAVRSHNAVKPEQAVFKVVP